MNCEQANILISAKIDGEIDSSDLAALERHLAECPSCRAVEQALAAQDEDLERAFAPRRLAATALAERVISKLEPVVSIPKPRTSQRSWWSSWGKPLAAAAAGFALALLITRPWQPQVAVNPPMATHPVTSVKPVGQLALATGALALMHIGAALHHRLILKDGVMRRMLPWVR